MKLEKEILKGNGLTNIDELMDSQFGKPGTSERERFREKARIYVNGHAKTEDCRNSQKKQKSPVFPVRSDELENTTSVTSNSSLMQVERGDYLKSPHLVV